MMQLGIVTLKIPIAHSLSHHVLVLAGFCLQHSQIHVEALEGNDEPEPG